MNGANLHSGELDKRRGWSKQDACMQTGRFPWKAGTKLSGLLKATSRDRREESLTMTGEGEGCPK